MNIKCQICGKEYKYILVLDNNFDNFTKFIKENTNG